MNPVTCPKAVLIGVNGPHHQGGTFTYCSHLSSNRYFNAVKIGTAKEPKSADLQKLLLYICHICASAFECFELFPNYFKTSPTRFRVGTRVGDLARNWTTSTNSFLIPTCFVSKVPRSWRSATKRSERRLACCHLWSSATACWLSDLPTKALEVLSWYLMAPWLMVYSSLSFGEAVSLMSDAT